MKQLPVFVALLVGLLLAGGCGEGDADGSDSTGTPDGGPVTVPSEDYSSSFVGAWSGLEVIFCALDGQRLGSSWTTVEIAPEGHNRLSIPSVCPDGSALPAAVTSPRVLSVDAWKCPAASAFECSAAAVEWTSGSGVSEGGMLTLVFEGILRGCRGERPIVLQFEGRLPTPASESVQTP